MLARGDLWSACASVGRFFCFDLPRELLNPLLVSAEGALAGAASLSSRLQCIESSEGLVNPC